MAAVWREDEDSHASLLLYSIYCMDEKKSWFSSNRTSCLSFEYLAYVMKCFAYRTKLSSVIYPNGWTLC
jgi:hypothetical protein